MLGRDFFVYDEALDLLTGMTHNYINLRFKMKNKICKQPETERDIEGQFLKLWKKFGHLPI